jgi:hypothetical protein
LGWLIQIGLVIDIGVDIYIIYMALYINIGVFFLPFPNENEGEK